MHKYADDSYLVTAGKYGNMINDELDHVNLWAKNNNLCLNKSKTFEIVFFKRGGKRTEMPSLTAGIKRVTTISILGVTLQGNLLMDCHISKF